MISFEEVITVVIDILYVILLITAIIFLINGIKTIKKANQAVDNVNHKLASLDGFFNVIDSSTDLIVGFNEKLLSFIGTAVNKIFKKKEKDKNE